ncbi:MAG: phycobilisome protein [Leptolyngbyaceae bacterium]|nr:phycobilisome protein [Leptolyngbyaceae bacterium]
MHAINNELAQRCISADGRYLDSIEMQTFEKYVNTYQTRLKAYQEIRQKSDELVLSSLRKWSRKHPTLVQRKGKRCHYDMTEMLRYMALSILRDDELFFQETLTIWLDTILVAHQKHHHCADAYNLLSGEVSSQLSADCAHLVKPYLEHVVQLLDSHADN